MLDDIDTFLALNSQKNLSPRPLNKTEQHNEVLFFFLKQVFKKSWYTFCSVKAKDIALHSGSGKSIIQKAVVTLSKYVT